MAIRKYSRPTPGRRGSSVADFVEITRTTPEKSLTGPLAKKGGRNNRAASPPGPGWRPQACVPRHRLPSLRQDGVPAKVGNIEYDPNRTARIALPALRRRREALHRGAARSCVRARSWSRAPAPTSRPATTCRCRNIPVGTTIHCVELRQGGGAKIARSAGNSAQLVAKEGSRATLRMPSARCASSTARCRASLGEVGNAEQFQHQLGQGPAACGGRASARPSAVSS